MKITRTPKYIKFNTDNTIEFVIDMIYSFNDNIGVAFNPNLSDSELMMSLNHVRKSSTTLS